MKQILGTKEGSVTDTFKVPEIEKEQTETDQILENFAKRPINKDAAPSPANNTAAAQGAPVNQT